MSTNCCFYKLKISTQEAGPLSWSYQLAPVAQNETFIDHLQLFTFFQMAEWTQKEAPEERGRKENETQERKSVFDGDGQNKFTNPDF